MELSSFGTLTVEQEHLVEQLKADVADTVSQHPELQLFCSHTTYVRYMRARGWNLHKASKMLRDTLKWRLDYKPHELTWSQVGYEAETGKNFLTHFQDSEGRPTVLMRPRNENTKVPEGQIRYLIYILERASGEADRLGHDHKMTWLIDFEGYSMRNAAPLKTSIAVMGVLQNHYPERLGCAICYHAPKLFSVTWKGVAPFLDPVTKKKVQFVDKGPGDREHMAKLFDLAHIEEDMSGDLKGCGYSHVEYSARMQQLEAHEAAALAALRLASPPPRPASAEAGGTATVSAPLGLAPQKGVVAEAPAAVAVGLVVAA